MKGRDVLPGGLGDDRDPAEFNMRNLIKGIKVEREHTDDPWVALEIAVDLAAVLGRVV